jgi:exoribonuclease II
MKNTRVIEFYHKKKITVALCSEIDIHNLHCITEEGDEMKLNREKVLQNDAVAADAKFTDDKATIVPFLRALAEKRDEIARSIGLRDLWEICLDEARTYSLEELCEIYFGKNHTADERSALFRLIESDRLYFKRNKELYSPQDSEHINGVTEQRRMAEERAKRHEIVGRNLKSVYEGRTREFVPEALEFVPSLVDVCIKKRESPRYKEVMEVLHNAGITSQNAPFEILVKGRIWNEDENILLHEYKIGKAFPDDVAEESGHFESFDMDERLSAFEDYRDCTSLAAYTIDDETTKDLDDAISLEEVENGFRIGIHIADITSFVPPGSPIDREAHSRGSTIYLPDLKIEMIPALLSEKLASLVEGERRPALSFFAFLDREGNMIDYEICRSIIRVSRRLTYDEVDRALSENRFLGLFNDISRKLLEKRIQKGCIYTPFPRIIVTVSPQGEIRLRKDDPAKASQIIVSEMMILANSMAGEFCVRKGLPGIFRGQMSPGEDYVPCECLDPFTLFTMRKHLKKGTVGTTPSRHHGLGAEHYVQVTSPLRRYSDLIMHRQIKHFLEFSAPLHSGDELAGIIGEMDGVLDMTEILERERKNYWIMKYLEMNTGKEDRAIVFKVFSDRMIVQLQETLFETECPKPRSAEVAPGDMIIVAIELVWPRENTVRLSFRGKFNE